MSQRVTGITNSDRIHMVQSHTLLNQIVLDI